MSALARVRLVTLRKGIDRGRDLLEQLLSLAKAQAALDRPKTSVSIRGIYTQVLEDLMPLADQKQIDIGVEGTQDAQVWACAQDISAVVKNLVDNAIRYTPVGGKVDLSVTTQEGRAVMRIQDSGPGIPAAERGRVFDPFYRTLGSDQIGSGLGLSIVKAVTDRIGAEIQLAYTDDAHNCGLRVFVILPLAPAI